MARRLRAPAVLAEDQSSFPACTLCYSQLLLLQLQGVDALIWPLQAFGFTCTYFYTDKLHIVRDKMYLLKTLEDKFSDYFLNPCLRKCFRKCDTEAKAHFLNMSSSKYLFNGEILILKLETFRLNNYLHWTIITLLLSIFSIMPFQIRFSKYFTPKCVSIDLQKRDCSLTVKPLYFQHTLPN